MQAPFDLPAVDKGQLQQKLFKGLDSIIACKPLPFPFDQNRWAEVFHGGLDQFITKPRDVVRILNTLSVAYPPLAGEVNPVDFVALESLRVFAPAVYRSIRDAEDVFCGQASRHDREQSEERAYLSRWKESLPDFTRDRLVGLVGRIFPRVQHVLGPGTRMLSDDDDTDWRRELRPCHSDCFGVYFQFGVPPGCVSRAELDRIVAAETSEVMAALLLAAKDVVFPDGHSKVRDLIERLRDLEGLAPDQAEKLVEALTGHGHLLLRNEDERGGLFVYHNRARIGFLAAKLLEQLPTSERVRLLSRLAATSSGLWMLVDLADDALRGQRDPSKVSKAFHDLGDNFPGDFARSVAGRLDNASLSELTGMPDLGFIVHRWNEWAGSGRIREIFRPMVESDDGLISLLDKFVTTGLRHDGAGTSETYHLSMSPLSAVMDFQAVEPRIRTLQARPDLTPRQRKALTRFLQGMEALANGQDPDAARFHEDD